MWLTGRLTPDFKTIANFRKDNGKAIRNVCRQFVVLCQRLELFSDAVVAIDGSKFKAVNSSDRHFTPAKLKRRMEEIEANIGRYLAELDAADRQEPAAAKSRSVRLHEKIAAMKEQMNALKEIEARLEATGETQISLTDPDARSMITRGAGIVGYNVQTAVDAKHHLIVEHEVTVKKKALKNQRVNRCHQVSNLLHSTADAGFPAGAWITSYSQTSQRDYR